MNPTVLDPCCGSRMMWFDKQDQRVRRHDLAYFYEALNPHPERKQNESEIIRI